MHASSLVGMYLYPGNSAVTVCENPGPVAFRLGKGQGKKVTLFPELAQPDTMAIGSFVWLTMDQALEIGLQKQSQRHTL